MRRLLSLALALTVGAAGAAAQGSDYDGVAEAVSYYLDGGTTNDFETLARAFHPTATMRYLTDDGYADVNAVDFFRERMRPGPPQDRTTRIVAIDVAGDAATAKLEIEYPTFTFVDYMTLLKIDGEWKIVSKVFVRRPHAHAAGS